MSEHFDPLEAELAALKPEQPSPRLQQRIADQLRDKSKATASGWFDFARQVTAHRAAGLTAAAGLAACALAASVLTHRSRPTLAEPPAEIPQPLVATAFDDTLPTVWAYQRALAHSPQELEALFDKHALLASPIGSRTPASVFIHSQAELRLLGEL